MNHSNAIRVIIIDDEEEARDVISTLLSEFRDVQIIGMAGDADAGLALIVRENPDLVLLDISMPRKTGLDMVAELRNFSSTPAVVFVTAYDEFAIRAFKVSALDYLLKPVDPQALADMLMRYRSQRQVTDLRMKVDSLLNHFQHPERLRLNTRSGFLLIDPGEVMYAEADGNYTTLCFAQGGKELFTMTIGRLFEMMPAGQFARISRSVFINRNFLYRVDRKKRECELRKEGVSVQLGIARDHLHDII
jgi:two-component system LytT family response regulator